MHRINNFIQYPIIQYNNTNWSYMETFSQGRVQFFQTQSSYSSASSLSSSRYINFVQQIIQESATIRSTLKAQLTYEYSENIKSKLKFIMNRASILVHYTIPEQLRYFQRPNYQRSSQIQNVQNHSNSQGQLKKCLAEVQSICKDYQQLTTNQISYEQFYITYADIDRHTSAKQGDLRVSLNASSKFYKDGASKFQQIQTIEPIKYMRNSSTNFNRVDSHYSRFKSQNKWLIQQISELKQQLLSVNTSHQIQIQTLKLNYQKRIQRIIKMKQKDNQKKNLQQQLSNANRNLVSQIEQKLIQIQKKAQLQFQIQALKRQNQSLQKQILRANQISASRLELQQSGKLQQLIHSNFENSKKMRNDKSLVKLLKFEVQKERLKTQGVKNQFKKQGQLEVQKYKKNIRQLNKKIQQILFENDSLRQKNQHLSQYLQAQKLKFQQKIKQLNGQIILAKEYKNKTQKNFTNQKSLHLDDRIMAKAIQIQQYQGDGLEGFIHYQCLQKQFKYRFKRACLKQKELLYKKNGLQIGLITNIISKTKNQRKFQFTIYLTNFSDHSIKNIHAKVMNYFKIIGAQTIQILKAGDQKKMTIQLQILCYPIGPVLLLINGTSSEQIRVLLPANIFKLFTFEQNKQKKFMRPTQIKFNIQRRIVKNSSFLKDLFNIKSNSQSLSLIGHHSHSNTSLILHIQLQKQVMKIIYEQLNGNQKIVQYFIKCFSFLVKKNN